MGDFILKVHGVGGHGCNREAKAGDVFLGCGKYDCIDCAFALKVDELRKRFPNVIQAATFTHWPVELNHMGRSYDEAHEVVDDLNYYIQGDERFARPVQRKRIKGEFGK